MWDENVAARGGQRLGCCVNKHLGELQNVTKEINLHGDCCSGQYRNVHVTVTFLLKIKEFHSKEILQQ